MRRFFACDASEGDEEDGAEQETVLKYYDGAVVAYLPVVEGELQVELWHVMHDDGDEEDLEEAELLEAIENLELNLREPTEGYERERARLIARNKAKLVELGLERRTVAAEAAEEAVAAGLTVRGALSKRKARLDEEPQTRHIRHTRRRLGEGLEAFQPLGVSERMATRRALQNSLLTAKPGDAEAPFRPTEYADEVMAKRALRVDRTGLVQGLELESVARDGPFKRNADEISAERAVVMVDENKGTLLDVDVGDLGDGEAVVIKLTNEVDAAADAAMSSKPAETDFVYLQKGLSHATGGHRRCRAHHTLLDFEIHGIKQTVKRYKEIRKTLENAWHEQHWAKYTNDPHGKHRRSTEVHRPIEPDPLATR